MEGGGGGGLKTGGGGQKVGCKGRSIKGYMCDMDM
jgi:hypothetical protein